jgi:nitrite reductase/ring-hydroxylating ferredoxin subunit
VNGRAPTAAREALPMNADNPARPQRGAALCALEAIRPGGAIALDFAAGDARFSMIVARTVDGVFAYENVCPHARSPLERPDGRVVVHDKRFIVCSAHGASFRMADGRCVAGPGLGTALNRIGVVVVGGVLRIAPGD